MIIKKIFALVLLLLLSQVAFASNLFEPSSGDISLKILSALFGGLLDSGGQDPLLEGIKVFNGGVLLIGGVLAGYTVFSSVLMTAHDGEVLGKKFSSVWIPIRYSIGTAVVLPIVGGGYCVMQAIVMWLVVQGIGLADAVWSSFMSNPIASANTRATTTNRENILNVAKASFTNSICYRSYSLAVSNAPSILKWATSYDYSMRKTAQGYEFGDSKAAIRKTGCGTVNYPEIAQDKTVSNAGTPNTNAGYLGNIGTIFAPLDVSSLIKSQNTQTDTLVKAMDSLASKVIEARQKAPLTAEQATSFYAQIEQATDTYVSNIKSSADGLGNGDAFSAIKKSATDQGWILGGAWFTRIVQMNSQIYNAVNSTPNADRSSPILDGAIFSDAKQYLQSADDVLSQSKDAIATDVFNTEEKEENKGKSEDVGGLLKKVEASIMKGITTVNLYELKNDGRHPLIIVQDLGQRLETLSWIIMSALSVVAGLAGVFLPGSAVAVVEIIGWFANVPIKLLMAVALGTQYILPNLPFIIWIGCIVGWVLLVIEAIIAAPLWAIMHLHPNGDDATGKGGSGYSLVLSLLLRPVLMIFGLMSALVISNVIGEFINKIYFEVFAQNTGSFSGFSALTALSMGTLLYFIIIFIFLRKVFSIIHMLPDQLLKWIGGGAGGLGQFAGEFAQASDKGSAAGAALGGAVASTGANLMKKGVSSFNDNLENKGSFDAISAKNNAQQTAENPQSNDDYSSLFSSQTQAQQEKNDDIEKRTASLPQSIQPLANKINNRKVSEDGKPSFNLSNASKSLPLIEQAIQDVGEDKVSIVAQDVLSQEHKKPSDDIRDFTKKIDALKDVK